MLRLDDKARFEKVLGKKIKARRVINLVVILGLFLGILVLFITKSASFTEKTLWDWLDLFFIPLFLILVVWGLNWQDHKTDMEIAKDNQREMALQHYFDLMMTIILDKDFKKSDTEDDIRDIVRVKTITTIEQLDVDRKRQLLNFLSDIGLIWRAIPNIRPLISLSGAELEYVSFVLVNLTGAHLTLANLNSADLSLGNCYGIELAGAKLNNAKLEASELANAELSLAKMVKAKLKNANLENANLRGTNLTNADLRNANVKGANFKGAILSHANFQGAEYNAETIWPDSFNPIDEGAKLV